MPGKYIQITPSSGGGGPGGGTTIFDVNGVPSSGIGADGDAVFALDTGIYYRKLAGVWVTTTKLFLSTDQNDALAGTGGQTPNSTNRYLVDNGIIDAGTL